MAKNGGVIRPSEQPHRPPSSTIARVASAAHSTVRAAITRDASVTSTSSVSFDAVCGSRVASGGKGEDARRRLAAAFSNDSAADVVVHRMRVHGGHFH